MNIVNELKRLTGKNHVYLTKGCTESLDIAVNFSKGSKKRLLIQEEGGWLTFPQLAEKHGLERTYLTMEDGRINQENLKKYSDSILLLHSLPGYCYDEKMQEIAEICKKRDITLINDCCGSIGTEDAKIGDIVVCSFGRWKPLSAGGGGFIALNSEMQERVTVKNNLSFIDGAENKIDLERLQEALTGLQEKLKGWKIISGNIKKEIRGIMNPGSRGYNVLADFGSEANKETLINYCKNKGLEYTICPRYIRTNKNAVCIEVKRCEHGD